MKRLLAAAVAVGLCLAVTIAHAQELQRAIPEEVGLSTERLGRISERLKADVEKGTIPGAVLLIARQGQIAYFEAFGHQDPETKAPMARDSIFRIYSMTKPLTSVAIMMLVEEGKLGLDTPLARIIPAFAEQKVAGTAGEPVPARRPITIQDLMRHSSGITYGFFGEGAAKKAYVDAKILAGDFDNAEFAERIAKLPLAYEPGTTWDYSHSTDILGRVVEVVSGRSLYQFLRDRLLDPLGMNDTAFYVTDKQKQGRIAEPFKNDRSIGVDVDFFDPRVAGKYESGGGGLTGTAMDYARFLQMMLNEGEYNDRRYLSPAIVDYMTSDHLGSLVKPGPYYLPGPGYGFGLGFAVRIADGMAATPGSIGEYNWGGAGGTAFWVDPEQDMFVVFMMQSPKMRLAYRSLIRNMVYAAITE